MEPLELVGQGISIAAMACNIISYQQKKQSTLLFCRLLGGALFCVSYFLLGATIGGLLNLLAVIRAVLFLFHEKLHMKHPLWLCGFVALYLALYVLGFTVFGIGPKPIAFAVELLPVVGMTALSVAFMLDDTAKVRRLGLISSPAWLIYNIYYMSLGAIICEVLSLCSIIIGILRHDREGGAPKSHDGT